MRARRSTRPDLIGGALAALPILVAAILSLAYWPGLVTWDSIRQYDQALSGDIDDWHPPMMEWIWRQLLPIDPSPAPMLLIQLGLYVIGLGLLARWAFREGRRGLGAWIGACALMPIVAALMGTIIKDSLMTGALLVAVGLLAVGEGRRWTRWTGIALTLFAATLRFNAFLAGVPLALALLPQHCVSTRTRQVVATVVSAIALILAMPLANRAIGAKPSGVALSLVIFDLGGITEHSGEDAFPPLAVGDAVAINHRCYSPVKWDSYSWWVDPLCPIDFDHVRAAFAGERINPYLWWLRQVARHPVAYAEHRLAHWNINARFLVADEIERPVQAKAPPNDWHFHVTPNAILSLVDRGALASAHTPLGWPCAWIALAAGIALASPRLESRRIILPLAMSALLYGLGYAVFSVASELRYYLWTMVAAAIAGVVALADLRRQSPGSRAALVMRMAGPLLLVSLMAWTARGGAY